MGIECMVPFKYNFIKVETPAKKAYERADATTQGKRKLDLHFFKQIRRQGILPKTIKNVFYTGNLPATQGNVKKGMYLCCGRMVLQHYGRGSTFCVGGHPSIKILGSGNYTRWLVRHKCGDLHPGANTWGQSLTSPLPVSARSSKKFQTAFRVWVCPPPLIVHTTQAVFIWEQMYHLWVPTTSQNFGAKSQNQPLRWL